MKKRLIYICLSSILSLSFLHSNAQESRFETAVEYFINKQYQQAQNEFEDVIKFSSDTLEKAKSYNNLGILSYNKGLYTLALSYYNKADSMFSLIDKQHVFKSNIYMNIGIIEKNRGNYYSAIQKYLHAEAISLYNKETLNLVRVYTNFGNVYKNLNDYSKAISYHKKSFQIRKDNILPDLDYPLINLADVYALKGVYDTAQMYYKQALKYSVNRTEKVQQKRKVEYALLLNKMGERDNAESIVKSIEGNVNIDDKGYSNLELYLILGDYYTAAKNWEKAIVYYDLCINFLSGFAEKEGLKNFPNKFMIQAISGKANLLYLKYLDTKNIEYLSDSYQSFKRALQYIEDFGSLTLLPESRIMFSHAEQKSFDGIIACLYELWESTHDKKYLHEALYLSSNYKAAELSDYQNKIKREGNNESVFSQNQALIEELNYTIYKVNTSSNALEENIALYNQIDSLYERIKPDTETTKKVSINDFILELTESTPNDLSIVDYILTENAVFSFIVNKGNILFTKQNTPDSLVQTIQDYYNIVSQPHWDINYNTFLSAYYKKGLKLYSLLIEPVEKNLKTRLKIIPDENLYLIPFDCLPYEKGITPERIRHIKPLLEKYAISYDYSLQAYLNSNAAKFKWKMTIFSPSYGEYYSDVNDLEKIKEIKNIFINKKSYENAEATKEAFLKSKQEGLFLLSMHGEVDENNPNLSYLVFKDDSVISPETVLYNYEIPSRDYSNCLFILNACKTGKGRLYNASGIQSLGKTFRSQGATVVSSAWNLDNYSSHVILLKFYKNLKAGLGKDIALKEAKIEFLKDCYSFQENPYYWSSINLYGNEKPIKRKNKLLYVLGGLAIVFVSVIFYFRGFR